MRNGSGPNPVALDRFIVRASPQTISSIHQSKNLHITRNGSSVVKKLNASPNLSGKPTAQGIAFYDSGNRITTAQNDNRMNTLIALTTELPEFSDPAARGEMKPFKITEKSVQQPEIVSWSKTNVGREKAIGELANRLEYMENSNLIENVPNITHYDMYNKPSYKKTTTELWEAKVDPIVLGTLKAESQPQILDVEDVRRRMPNKVWVVEQEEKFSCHEVRDPIIKEVDKDKLQRMRNGREYLLLPSERRAQLEQEVMEERWRKEKKTALAKDTRLKIMMNNAYRTGILGGETVDEPEVVYKDKNQSIMEQEERSTNKTNMRREFLGTVAQSVAGRGTLDFAALVTATDENKYDGGSKIFQNLTQNEISQKMYSSKNVTNSFKGLNNYTQNEKRLGNIFENQTKGRNFNIITGALIEAPKAQ
jgi:hypothetical protein